MSLTLTITEIRPQKEINFKATVARAIIAECGSSIDYQNLPFFKGLLAGMNHDHDDRKKVENIIEGIEAGKTYRAEQNY